MKRRLLALLLAALLTACTAGGDLMRGVRPAAQADRADRYDRAEADAAAMDFAVRLLQSTAQPGQSALLSPWSVWSALGMAAGGAAGATQTEMAAALGLPAGALGAYLADYTASVPDDGCLHSANGLWLRDDPGLTVEEDFLQFNADYYGAAAHRAPFDAATLADINAWVSENTAGRIPRILEQLDARSMLVLINALSFDAEWEDIYTTDQVRAGTFTAADGRAQTADFLHSEESVFLQDGQRAAGFVKYYAGRRYAFAVLLPAAGTTVEAYLAGLTGARLAEVLQNADTGATVWAAMPKYTLENTYELTEPLSAMGMASAFGPQADFTAMGRCDGGLHIGRVVHKTFLAVDERGTRAGAATAVAMDAGTAMPGEVHEVRCDRPFVFLLLDAAWNMPLFVGTVQAV